MVIRGKSRWYALFALLVGGILLLPPLHRTPPPPSAHASTKRPIMAFYYPWWEMEDWTVRGNKMSDLPDPLYSGGDETVMDWHITQAEEAGIDALVCTWYGPNETRLNSRCQWLQQRMAERGSSVQLAIIPDQSAWSQLQDVHVLADALAALQRDFISKPNYLTFQGKPAVFWFYPPSLGGVQTWVQLRNQADPNHEQFWFGGTDDFSYLEVYDTLYYFDITWERSPGAAMASYNGRLAGRAPFVATVMPGYDDIRYRNGHMRERENGAYYAGTWQDAIDYNADAVVITSFNEFYEGSHIEPSQQYGDLYLRLTREWSAAFHGNTPPPQPTATAAATKEDCFDATGYCIQGRIRDYWHANGGLPVFGFPITPQREEVIEGKAYQVQWFERNRLELHPENAPPYDVLLGRLSDDILLQHRRDWHDTPQSSPKTGCLYFAETGFNVCGDILAAWHANGLELDGTPGKTEDENIALFGLPLGDAQMETIQGKQYMVQWFERARFEVHPENAPPYNVLLGLLGNEIQASTTP